MAALRLNTSIRVQAAVRLASLAGYAVTVLRKGEATSGSLLIKLDRRDLGCMVLVETRDAEDAQAWFRGTGPEPVDDATASAYIDRACKRDPDLWIVEVDDREGRFPFDGAIVAG